MSVLVSSLCMVVVVAQTPAADPAEAPAPASAPTPSPPPVKPKAQPKISEANALGILRGFEERLSVGQSLNEDDIIVLLELGAEGVTGRVRAQAAAVMPWLPPARVLSGLLDASADGDATVRLQAVEGLNALARRLFGEQKKVAIGRALELLDDEDESVACAGGGLLTRLDVVNGPKLMERRVNTAGDLTWSCWRRLVPLPRRNMRAPPPPKKPKSLRKKPKKKAPKKVKTQEPVPELRLGGPLFITTAATVGFGVGGSIMSLAIPSRDTITYSSIRTTRRREEPSVASGFATGVALSAALGAGAWALDRYVTPISVEGASGAALGAAMGTVAGFGLALNTASSEQGAAAFGIGGASVGFGVGTALAVWAEPSGADLGASASMFTQGLLLSTLVSFAATPIGVPQIFDRVPRVDFAFGNGLSVGGALGLVTLAASPLLDLDGGRLLLATGLGLSTSTIFLVGTYLAVPVDVDVRQRIAAGVGAGALVLGTSIAWFLVPESWSAAVSTSGGAVDVKDGKVSLKVPVPQVINGGAYVPLASGTF